jgi:hypothetical protein
MFSISTITFFRFFDWLKAWPLQHLINVKIKILKTAFFSNLRCGQATKCKNIIVVIFWKYYSKKSKMKVSKLNLKEELDENSS